ncbi:MAG: F0F1 ATP synthase subunit epsilon [Deltaproteobacteria bacterium]|nr:F0F1 ATP synthase subunit epsilon [Deltaproteobacteria bacterium]
MTENIRLEIVTPVKNVVSEDAQIIMAPGILGEFGVLVGHTPFLTALKTGAITYKDVDGKERYVFVNGGFAEALPDKVTILAESAERRSDINISRAEKAKARALKRLEDYDKQDEVDFIRSKAALQRAVNRINLAQNI